MNSNSKIDIGEHSILELLVRRPAALRNMYLSKVNFVAQWNEPWFELSPHEVSNVMRRLLDKQLVTLSRQSGRPVLSKNVAWKDYEARQVKHQEDLFCELTTTGATLWEKIAMPHWTKFYSFTWRSKLKATLDVISYEMAKQVLAVVGWQETCILSIKGYRKLSPWRPTYWKVIPCGLRLTCSAVRYNNPVQFLESIGLHDVAAQRFYISRMVGDAATFREWFIHARALRSFSQ